MRILVVGSISIDMTTVTEVFPEASATVTGTGFSTAPGGKGNNQASQCALLGAEVTMVARVGNDVFGTAVAEALRGRGADVSHIRRSGEGIPTGTATILITRENGKVLNNRIIVVPGANGDLRAEDLDFLEDTIEEYDILLLQLEIPMEINVRAAQIAHAHGVPVMLNPAPIVPLPEELVRCSTYISPNEVEVKSLIGCGDLKEDGGIDDAKAETVRSRMKELGLEKMLITLGDQGAVLLRKDDGEILKKPCVRDIRVVDPTAAGDSFVGAFCTAKAVGADDEKAMEFANITAAITVTGLGASTSLPTIGRVLEFAKGKGLPTDTILRVMDAGRK